MDLIQSPNVDEVRRAVNQMASALTAGHRMAFQQSVQSQRSKSHHQANSSLSEHWNKRSVPQEFRDALIVHIFKRKGDRCDDHRGISLLSIPGKILERVILNSAMDMIFTARQPQQKCREQQRELYAVFVDLTKAFDSVDSTALWEILLKIGCPTDFVTIIRSFHEGMRASIIENGEVSPDFEVTNGTKQGCGLVPLLFVIFFSMLRVAFRDYNLGIPICYRTDGDLFIFKQQRKSRLPSYATSSLLMTVHL